MARHAKGTKARPPTGTVRAFLDTRRKLRVVAGARGEHVADVLERLLRKPLAAEYAKVIGSQP